ncbi:MTAP family purine nucleoside phosphorylase [Thiocapsa sp.]|uniref:MTAP family purine nucleoside phosphorylase n=1 Tax=Thiocapsa sp. TaxID=2024551 RepID=UPI003593C66C
MRIAIIGGSGLEDRLSGSGLLESPEAVEVQTPFGSTSAPIVVGNLTGTDVQLAVLKRHGTGHTIPPHRVPYRANLYALKTLGVTHIVATGAVGSLREEIRPGGVLLVDQFIDRTSGRGTAVAAGRGTERTFFDAAAVHVEFADPCCPVMRDWLQSAAPRVNEKGIEVYPDGTYICIDGPTFSTRAESEMHRAFGADVVGMTALPEARLAREAEIAYALIALPTDYDCWKARASKPGQPPESLLLEIIGNLLKSADAAAQLIEAALRDVSMLRDHPSPAHDALKLGIWTKKELIPAVEVERLRPIWGRYFQA